MDILIALHPSYILQLHISDTSQYTYCDISGSTLPKEVRNPVNIVESGHVGACLFTSAAGTESYSCLISPLPTQGSSNPSLTWTETFLTQSGGAGTDTEIPTSSKYAAMPCSVLD